MSNQPQYEVGPPRPRWTQLALRVRDIETSIEWYEQNTPLRVLLRTTDQYGKGVWLADPQDATQPFVLSLSQFDPNNDPFAYAPATVLGPYAHIGIELLSREAVDEAAARAEAEGALTFPPTELPPPVGYICFVEDPDGNTIQFSYDQGTYAIISEKWGKEAPLPTQDKNAEQ